MTLALSPTGLPVGSFLALTFNDRTEAIQVRVVDIAGGGGGTPGGPDGSIQFNDGGSFGGFEFLQWNDTTRTLLAFGDPAGFSSWSLFNQRSFTVEGTASDGCTHNYNEVSGVNWNARDTSIWTSNGFYGVFWNGDSKGGGRFEVQSFETVRLVAGTEVVLEGPDVRVEGIGAAGGTFKLINQAEFFWNGNGSVGGSWIAVGATQFLWVGHGPVNATFGANTFYGYSFQGKGDAGGFFEALTVETITLQALAQMNLRANSWVLQNSLQTELYMALEAASIAGRADGYLLAWDETNQRNQYIPQSAVAGSEVARATFPIAIGDTSSTIWTGGSGGAGNLYGCLIVPVAAIEVNQMSCFLTQAGGGGDSVQMGIYDFDGNLLVQTSQATPAADGVLTIATESTITLTPGTPYYLAVWSNQNGAGFMSIINRWQGAGESIAFQVPNSGNTGLPGTVSTSNKVDERFWVVAQ